MATQPARIIKIAALLLALLATWFIFDQMPRWRLYWAFVQLEIATTDNERLSALKVAARQSLAIGKNDQARRYATEVLALLPKANRNWDYGNAVHVANLVLGRISLAEGRVADAKFYLLEAGKTPGSPQLRGFGCNMRLATELLEIGEREVVLQYLENCRRIWVYGDETHDRWEQEIRSGRVPDFGANLIYDF